MKKMQGWMVGGIIGIVAFLVLSGIVFVMNMTNPGSGAQLWDFFGKIYLTNSLSNPILDIFTIVIRWGLIGAIIGMLFDFMGTRD